MNDDEDFDIFDGEDDGLIMDAAPDTITVRNERSRRSWRDIERLREQREIERLNTHDSWFEELDSSL